MRISNAIHLLRIDFEINLSAIQKIPRFVNVLILFGDKITLVDTGVKGSESLIYQYIESNNRSVSEIGSIILSHAHPDHIGAAATIKQHTGCSVFAHKNEKQWIENIEMQNQQRPVPGFFNLVDKPVMLDGFITDRQLWNLAPGLTLKFIASPGHSAGSLNILFKEDKVLFTADSIPLKGDIPNYDNFKELQESLKSIKNNGDFEILLSSWAPPIQNSREIESLITDGFSYLNQIDTCVTKNYRGIESEPLAFCRSTVSELGLPPFQVNPIIDKAFRSHLV